MSEKSPGDPCTCGHPRNQHSGYGLGRCLTSCRARCERLTPPETTR